MATLEQRMSHGQQARDVLENEAFTRAFDNIEKEHIQSWLNSPARDPQGRETLWVTVKLLHKLKAMLEAEMQDGRMAMREMEHMQATESMRAQVGTY